MTRRYWQAAAWCALAVFSGISHAQELPWEKASIQVGAFFTTTDTELQINSDTLGVGAVVDLENTLGVSSDKFTYRVDGLYRFGSTRRHQIDLHYFNSRRSGDRVLDQDIQVGNVTFPATTAVSTEFNLRFINLDYSYAFFQDDRVRLSAAAGLHTTGVELKIDGVATVEEESFTAPLPVVGLRGEVALTQRWRLKGGADVFYLSFSGVQGSLADSSLAVEYLPFKHVGFGLGANSVRINVKADGDNDLGLDLNGKLKFNFTGAMLYVKAFF